MHNRTKTFLDRKIDKNRPGEELVEMLYCLIELLNLPDNDFTWSSWGNNEKAVAEISDIINGMGSNIIPVRMKFTILFAPTGPLQEVATCSGWGDLFFRLADKFNRIAGLLW